MKSLQEGGMRLLQEAERILGREVQSAMNDKDFNMVVRRAQESVELTLKGALKILGIDYPKIHDVAPLFSEQLQQKRSVDDPKVVQRIEEISLWLTQARTPSFYFEREYGAEDAERALQDAAFVLTEVKKLLGIKNLEKDVTEKEGKEQDKEEIASVEETAQNQEE